MKITLCSSASFYKELFPIKEELEAAGHEVLMPKSAEVMHAKGNFNVAELKTWYGDPNEFHRKAAYMKGHLEKIDEADAILVVNFEKNGVEGYVGGNGLLEMFYAWLHKKPIYLLNPVSKESALYEEVLGMSPICLNGDLSKLTKTAQVV